MQCPFCGRDKDKVVDSRTMSDGLSIRRRRECLECRKRFTTYERVENIPLLVKKQDERRETFDRDKVAKGIRIACQKRPVSEEQIQEITSRIERRVFSLGEREIASSVIGESIMEELSVLDQVAYVRFASVYRDFKDLNQFLEELSRLMKIKKKSSEILNPDDYTVVSNPKEGKSTLSKKRNRDKKRES